MMLSLPWIWLQKISALVVLRISHRFLDRLHCLAQVLQNFSHVFLMNLWPSCRVQGITESRSLRGGCFQDKKHGDLHEKEA